ncbi:MAG: histidine kinase dimerization/phosphoacceptor domain -containing protein [Rhizobiaceae bacterium]
MTGDTVDLTACDREPIHIPGSIQPHGVLLVVDPARHVITHGAGDVRSVLGVSEWLGADCAACLGDVAAARIATGKAGVLRHVAFPGNAGPFDLSLHASGNRIIVEIEPASSLADPGGFLPRLETAADALEKATDLRQLSETAAAEFRHLTGYARVMVYRFLDDGSGVVLASDTRPGMEAFLNHHFPASDIPRQARALYVRNLVRVIPDIGYRPAPLVPALAADDALDMSDCILRSVSPIHLQYLKNMGVAASASVSIVKDGALWGLIACHNDEPLGIPLDARGACRALAGALARQIKAREDTDAYRERVRLRTFEDRVVELLLREGSLDSAMERHLDEIMGMLDADGIAVLRGRETVRHGQTPGEDELRALAGWVKAQRAKPVFSTNELGRRFDLSDEARPVAAGLLAMVLSASEPWMVMWFRAEAVEIINWAGNPHKDVRTDGNGMLNPRASFKAWSETVRGKARRWSTPEVEAASRLARAVSEVWQNRRIRELNRELMSTLEQKDALIQQREFLLGEINHRVQNSLQLVSSFLGMQLREIDEPKGKDAIEEARRRIAAVSLVHRRLYRSDQIDVIDAARYIDELLDDLVASIGSDWKAHISRDLAPALIANDKAIKLGLVLTELVINANKYAYDGAAGPLRISLSENSGMLRLTVADAGKGRKVGGKGFGSRLIDALVGQLEGSLEFSDNMPGTKAALSVPV